MTSQNFFTVTDLARTKNCTQQHIRDLVRKGSIPQPTRTSAGFIWLRRDLEAAGLIPASTAPNQA